VPIWVTLVFRVGRTVASVVVWLPGHDMAAKAAG
jgi:hypothetical protein